MSLKILRVGDPHCTLRNIPEMERIIAFVLEKARYLKIDRIEFMGDLFHTHAVIRLEVQDFWQRTFGKLSEFQVLSLVGNHDCVGSKEKELQLNSLNVYKSMKNVTIVDKPLTINNIAYVPYMSDERLLTSSSKQLWEAGAKKVLIAHQTFMGATYENGFYAEDGVSLDLISQNFVVSGHIHSKQSIGDRCLYIGTPKWDTMSDANQEKGIWFFEHGEDGSILKKEFISTEGVAIPIRSYEINEGEESQFDINPSDRNYIQLIGKSSWISKMKKKYKGLGNIKAIPVDRKMTKIDKDSLKDFTLVDFLSKTFDPVEGVSKDEINSYLKEMSVG